MTMYAEERQQAIAGLVAPRGRRLGHPSWPSSTTLPRRPSAATSRSRAPGSGPPGARRCRAACSLTAPRDRYPRPRPGQRRARRTALPAPPWTCSPRPRHVLLDAGYAPPPASPRSCPGHGADGHHPRACPSRPASPELRHIDLRLLPGRVRRTTQAAVGADTVAAPSRAPRRRRVHRRQRPPVEHGLSTPDHSEAAVKRAIVAAARAGGRPGRRVEVRRRDRHPLRLRRRRRRPDHRRATSTADRRALVAAGIEVVVA